MHKTARHIACIRRERMAFAMGDFDQYHHWNIDAVIGDADSVRELKLLRKELGKNRAILDEIFKFSGGDDSKEPEDPVLRVYGKAGQVSVFK